jgi:hypothetical protein
MWITSTFWTWPPCELPSNITPAPLGEFHGPFPGGQLVQFYQSPNGSLSDFAVTNDASHSHVEDNVSIIDSQNVSITNGVIDGNNSPSGAGVMFQISPFDSDAPRPWSPASLSKERVSTKDTSSE